MELMFKSGYMRWIILIILMIVTPCWAGGKDKFKEAEEIWEKGEMDKASSFYTDAIKSDELSDSELVTAHYNIAVFHFFSSKADLCTGSVNEVLSLQPDHVGAYSLRANAYDMLGADDKALADWDKLLELNPRDENVYNDRSYFYLVRGELDKAISEMEMYLKLKPDSPEQLRHLDKLKARRKN